MVVAPLALRPGGNDDYRVLTNGSEATAARVVLRVTFKADTSRAQVAGLLGDAARDTTIEQLGTAVYTLQLPSTADLQTVSRLHDRFARDATVDSVKLEVGARR
jgi:HD superfamily phosphohydrolase YqeK